MKNGFSLALLALAVSLTACGGRAGSTGSLIPTTPVPIQSSVPSNDLVINGSFAQGNIGWTQSGNVTAAKDLYSYDGDGWDDQFTCNTTNCHGSSTATFNIATAGQHDVSLHFAVDGCNTEVAFTSPAGLTFFTQTLPTSMNVWESLTAKITFPAGTNTLTLYFSGSNCTARIDTVVIT